MKEKIEEIINNSYVNMGDFNQAKAVKELLNLFNVMNSNTKKQMEKYRDETAVETICRLQEKEYYS